MSQSQSHIENSFSADRARPQEHADALFEFGSPHFGTEGPPAAVPLGELTETDAARITEALQKSRADNTRRAYRSTWRAWQAWAEAHGHQPLPASPAAVAAYLADRVAEGAAAATLNATRAGISATHRDHALPDPTDNQGIRQTLKGLRRKAAGKGRGQAEPLTVEDVAAIIATAAIPRRSKRGMESPTQAQRRGAVDAAIAGLLFQGGLRRSEAAALTWADVSPAADADGLLVRIRHSKTDQEGERADVRFSRTAPPGQCGRCARRPRTITSWCSAASTASRSPAGSPQRPRPPASRSESAGTAAAWASPASSPPGGKHHRDDARRRLEDPSHGRPPQRRRRR